MLSGRSTFRVAGWAVVAALAASGCVSPLRRADLAAREGGLLPMMIAGDGFQHSAYAKVLPGDDRLVLFIEGDGSPWIEDGRTIADDPTPRTPIALDLALHTPASVLYLGRPCYFSARSDPACVARWWTFGRYSEAVVASMVGAANRFIQEQHMHHVLLVGYSGGGTLAVLMATRVANVTGVVSIAGNLDPDAWTQGHHYLPLKGSLNPASQAPLPANLAQWYLIGDRDTNVTVAMTARYLGRVSADRVWHFGAFSHACCWAQEWPRLYPRIIADKAAAAHP